MTKIIFSLKNYNNLENYKLNALNCCAWESQCVVV